MANTIWSKFYWSDWANDPALKLCSFAAQGLWMRMLCVAAEATPTGYVAVGGNALDETGIARLTGASLSEVADLLGELERNDVFSRDRHHRIYSRRMVADAKRRAIAVKNGKNGGNPTLRKQTDNLPRDKGMDNGADNTQEPEAKSQKKIEPIAQHSIAAAPRDRMDRLLDAAGIRGNPTTALAFAGVIFALEQEGYDFETEILPAIASKPNPNARNWNYFVPQIHEFVRRKRANADIARAAPPKPSVDWRGAVDLFRESGTWIHAWGPAPGEKGCRVPPELLREHAA